uniref:Uncharacterized protein n=1 Tax=Tanacetum cinerariifolium TaxID=118510 RepID=A0A6L2NRJ1_TANCI|nr:hypothetical protein [Tanacetum cinerariifolium]
MMEMYDQGKYWGWSFLKDGFFAGMTTSGRKEDEDFKTMNSRAVLSSVHPIKAKADQISQKKAKEFKYVFEDNSVGASQVDMMPQICVRDHVVKTKTKGCPKIATRVKSPIELQGNKKKTCSYCHELGYNITGCPKKKICKAKNDSYNALLENATHGVKKKKTDG